MIWKKNLTLTLWHSIVLSIWETEREREGGGGGGIYGQTEKERERQTEMEKETGRTELNLCSHDHMSTNLSLFMDKKGVVEGRDREETLV